MIPREVFGKGQLQALHWNIKYTTDGCYREEREKEQCKTQNMLYHTQKIYRG